VYTFNKNSIASGTGQYEPIEGYTYSNGALVPLGSSPFTFTGVAGSINQAGTFLFAGGAQMVALGLTSNGALSSNFAPVVGPTFNFVAVDSQ
jgi:hypothetical protein